MKYQAEDNLVGTNETNISENTENSNLMEETSMNMKNNEMSFMSTDAKTEEIKEKAPKANESKETMSEVADIETSKEKNIIWATSGRKKDTIEFLAEQNLWLQHAAGKGTSKYYDTRTWQVARRKKQAELEAMGMAKGKAFKASLKENPYHKIYSDNTLYTYIQSARSFETYYEETYGTKRVRSLEQVADHDVVQGYVYWMQDRGYSPYTIYTWLSGVCKFLYMKISDFEKPRRSSAEGTRSSEDAKNDAYNEKRAAKAMAIDRLLGARRSELAKIKLTDINYVSDSWVEVYTIGKGGRSNIYVLFIEEDVAQFMEFYQEALDKGQKYLLTKEEMKNDADFQACRRFRAQRVYNYVKADIERDPSRREYYNNMIYMMLKKSNQRAKERAKRRGKAYHPQVIKENLSSTKYWLRGKNRELMIAKGKPTCLDRTAAMVVSSTVTCHFRSDTTIANYIILNY